MLTAHLALIIILICILAVFTTYFAITKMKRRRVARQGCESDGNEQIYVGNLPYRTTEKDLRKFFEQYGEINSIRVIRDQATGRSRGFAFITYCTGNEAGRALVAHGQDLYGRQLVVRIAKIR